MKIAFLLGSLNRGGTETLMLDSFLCAAEADFEMMGIYRKKGDLYGGFSSTGVQLYQLAPKSAFDLGYFVRLRKLLKGARVDIVHAQQPLDAFYAYIATAFTRIKIVQTVHGYSKNAG